MQRAGVVERRGTGIVWRNDDPAAFGATLSDSPRSIQTGVRVPEYGERSIASGSEKSFCRKFLKSSIISLLPPMAPGTAMNQNLCSFPITEPMSRGFVQEYATSQVSSTFLVWKFAGYA